MKAVLKALAAALKALRLATAVTVHTMKKIGAAARFAATGNEGSGHGKVKSYKSIYKSIYGKTAEERKEARDHPEWVTNPELKAQEQEKAKAKQEMDRAAADEAQAKQDEEKAKKEEQTSKEEAKREKEAEKKKKEEAEKKKDQESREKQDKVKRLAGGLSNMKSASAVTTSPAPYDKPKEVQEPKKAQQLPAPTMSKM